MIEQRLRDDLTPAMKARDVARVRVLRSVLAALANAEAPAMVDAPAWPPQPAGTTEAARVELSDIDRSRILQGQITERENSAAELEGHGRHADAEALRAEIDVIRSYLE
jgi:uncharacterized protein YqeY